MNSLAYAVHGMVVGGKPVETVLHDLTAQERLALADMRAVLLRLPKDLASTLAKIGTQDQWWIAPPTR
jgi:hypothetical protein